MQQKKTRILIVLLALAGLFMSMSPGEVQADTDICLFAAIQCLGEASVVDWVSKMIVGHLLYCLNGYDFCRQYVIPFK